MPRRLLIAPLLAVAALAGCGGSSPSAPQGPGAAPGPKHTQETPSSTGLRVGATDLRLGDATTAGPAGSEQLPVGKRRVDPDALRRSARDRQGVGAGASCANADLLPDASNGGAVLTSTLCLINGERTDAGLPPLTRNAKLDAASRGHSQDMVERQFFDHVTPDGRDLVARVRPT